ncbi:MAG: class I tRNA ligase family protein, partial [Candidatus Methylomirabilis sp.]|nr:class I tRNA ligase family protein [Deltaproteobacteria bacterium]
QEDYAVGARYGLEVANPVGDDGVFQRDLPLFGGMSVRDANPKVVETLRERGALVKERRLKHSYPHCWRCKNPILFRATPQWFIGLDVGAPTIREGALEAIHRAVRWIPGWGKDRILGMMEKRPDWCISRQRAWGVPIVAFGCEDCGETLLDPAVMNHVADIFDQETSDAWFARAAKDLLPPGAACPKCGGGNLAQEANILDVWFDSGVSHAAVCERHPMLSSPADLYLEDSDQHRGWFNSSLLTSVGTRGRAPFKTVLTHGFVVDAKGRKMSKSLGNVIAPEKILKQYGAEILRLWVAAEDYRNDIRISDEILGHLAEAYRRIRNTARFLLSNLGGFDPERDAVAYADLPELDRWALLRLEQLTRRILKAYEEAEFHVVYHQLNNFCAVDLSALYLDIVKDRLYCEAPAGAPRRSAQTVCYRLADSLTRLMAPVLSFLAEEIWANLPGAREASVHLAEMPKPEEARLDAALEARWERLWALREAVTEVLEPQRASKAIGHSLEAVVTRLGAPKADLAAIRGLEPNLADLFLVSGVTVAETEGGSPVIETKPAKDLGRRKCARCWKYEEKTGADPAYPETCPRCASVLREMGHTAAA